MSDISGGTGDILPHERSKASFSVEALQEILKGKRPAQIEKFAKLFNGPEFDASMDDYLSYSELFEAQLGRATEAMKIIRDNPSLMVAHQAQKVGMRDLFDTGAMGIHFIAYLPFLQTQANDEQKKLWLKGAINAEYFGAYAQTELGHGSNVRALETTATFDQETDEFIIHTPKLTSLKWWPTGMYACTHGVVFAQLLVGGKSHGVFGFFMQFRDENGDLMPGVEIGEIGPKVGPSETNIGYARFTHVRVPRFNMFSKYAKLDRDGQFIAAPPKLSKFKYMGMMNIRVGMVSGASSAAAMAATIAIRYSCVRKQGFKDSKAGDTFGSSEYALMDYKMTQYRLFKCLGAAYLMLWTGRSIADFLKEVIAGVAEGNESAADQLPELHATCAGLKSHCTSWSSALIEDCRKCCGGQGYLRSSGIADLAANYVGSVTAEGEAVILALQTARYLIKAVNQARQGETVVGGASYVSDSPVPTASKIESFQGKTGELVKLLRDRARSAATDLTDDFNAAMRGGKSFDEALNSVAVLAVHASKCHCVYIMARNAHEALPKYVTDGASCLALTKLLDLVLLQEIVESGTDFIGMLERHHVRTAHANIMSLLDEIRPDAVALTDSFGFKDHHLKSTLGRFDGNVYEAIYEEAKLSPLNKKRMVGWDKLRDVLDMDFIRKNKETQRHLPSDASAQSKL